MYITEYKERNKLKHCARDNFLNPKKILLSYKYRMEWNTECFDEDAAS